MVRRLFHDQLRADQLFDNGEKAGLVVTCQRLKDSEIKAPAQYSGTCQSTVGRLAQPLGAPLDRIVYGARDVQFLDRFALPRPLRVEDAARSGERLEHLFDEERVPLGE